ncbi:MAG: hydantoinase B/oxoprolinase family protein [Actinomycetia bacterium]|nr:hydantoinase B/oxoprolinase family protein [Actinomycetes bacterium]
MSVAETRVDPITASVIAGALDSIAIEMGHKLAHMSYSSIIRESEDFGTVVCDAGARQLCESPQSTPLQSGPIPGYVRGINRRFAEIGEEWKPGDVVMHNHPYYGASHGPDVGFVVPVFFEDQLVGFSATTAHHLDIGALTPGSCGIVDATDAYAEGLQLTAIKVVEEGRVNEWVWRILRDNIRMSSVVVADMQAQIAAARIGAERFLELFERYGPETVQGASEDLMDYSEHVLRQEIERLPDGTYSAEGKIDGYLDHESPAYRDLPIVASVTVEGSDLEVDLTGTAPQVDLPINMPFEGTVDIAIYLVLRSILLDSDTHDPVPTNSGLFRPITITAPEGCLANPRYPAPTIARFVAGNIIAETVMRALAPHTPEAVAASVGNLKVIASSGLREGGHWVHMDIIEGSYGGRHGKDGLDAVDTLYGNTRNNPIEDIESHLPLRIKRYELWPDEAGAGQWRGGIGSVRDVEFTEPGGFSIEADGNKWPPLGAFGGRDGTAGSIILNPGTLKEEQLPSKIPFRKVEAGDTIRTIAPSAGGYGDPAGRSIERICEDIADGYVTKDSARRDYEHYRLTS